jgi:hypothetical protein
MLIKLDKLSDQVQASPHLAQERFSDDSFHLQNNSWGATSDVDVSEQQKTSEFLANMLIELDKVSDQVQTSQHLTQGRVTVASNFKLNVFRE